MCIDVYRKVSHKFRAVDELILSSVMWRKKPSCRWQRHLLKCDVERGGERPSSSQVAESLAKRHFGWPRLRSFQPESQVCLVNSRECTADWNCRDSPVVQKNIEGFEPQNDSMIFQWLRNLDLHCHASQSWQCTLAQNHSVGVGFAII